MQFLLDNWFLVLAALVSGAMIFVPMLRVARIEPSAVTARSGVRSLNSNSHSKSWRGRPVQAQIRCLTSTWRVVAASPSLNDGSNVVTGVSQAILC